MREKLKRKKKGRHPASEKGISSIESLLSLSLSLFLIFSCLEFFSFARKAFFKLKTSEVATQSALLAGEKMKTDILCGGLGLLLPLRLGVLKGIEEVNNALVIKSIDAYLNLTSDLSPGQIDIRIESTKGLTKGTEICISDGEKCEVKSISGVSKNSILISPPLEYQFGKDETHIFSVKKISFFFDVHSQIIRRKVGNEAAQPLLEEVSSFEICFEEMAHLLSVSFTLTPEKEKRHAFTVFAKNTALASAH